MAAQVSRLAPLATVLRPPPDDEVLTPDQWTTLLAIADTVIPSIRPTTHASPSELAPLYLPPAEYSSVLTSLRSSVTNPPPDNVLEDFLLASPSTSPTFRQEFQRTLALHIRDDARKGIALIITTLNTRFGSLVFNGTTVPFHLHPFPVRTALLASWTASYLPPLRVVSSALIKLIKSTYSRTSPHISPLLSFPAAPVHGQPGKGYDFSFLTPPPTSHPSLSPYPPPSPSTPWTLETDVVIVGSGCGAGVAAKNLSAAGHRVLVLEKAYHHAPEHLPMTELAASQHLYHNGGLVSNDDSSMTVIAGENFGGGGTINWSASLQPQAEVRQEWASQGLDFFTSAEFQACLDRVCERMGVGDKQIEHNFANRVLLEGSRRLGYTAKAVPQNTGGKRHYCGHCSLGCGSCEKQGPVVSWLPDAMEHGAKAMQGMEVERVIFEQGKHRGGKVAVGVKGTWTSRDGKEKREVIVKAKRVVLSAGSLFSPLVLLRSGLTNPNIGRHLHLHPVSWIFGVWPEEIRPWEGISFDSSLEIVIVQTS